MAKFGGHASLTLFNVQGEIEKEIKILSTERMLEKLGLSKPAKRTVQGFDLPLVPSQEDYFMFPFRHLSATTVGGGSYKATDFSKDGVLKRSTSKLKGKPAYLNHYQEVGKEVGVVGDTEYVQGYKHSSGLLVPAGIEGPYILDSKLEGNADLIRKLSAPISPIQSCSVSVIFEWEASHEFEREGDFYFHLGEMLDDEMVRRIVTNIIDYAESSMVWMGADPYAKMLDEKGKIINIDRTAAFAKQSFSQAGDPNKFDTSRRIYVFDCLDKEKFLHLSKANEKPQDPKTENIITMDEKLLAFLATSFGVTVEDLKANKFDTAKAEKFKILPIDSFSKLKSEEDFTKLTNEKKVVDDALAALKLEKATVDQTVVTLTTEKTNLEKRESLAKVGESVLKAAKDEAKRVYGIFSKGKPEKVIEDELAAETDMVKLEAKIKTFGGQAVTEFGGHCAACGSKDIKFRNSVNKDDNNGGGATENEFALQDAAIK